MKIETVALLSEGTVRRVEVDDAIVELYVTETQFAAISGVKNDS